MTDQLPLKVELGGASHRVDSMRATEFTAEPAAVHGLVALTQRLQPMRATFVPFSNATTGLAMNVDGSSGGTPVVIHNGTDSVAWTATNISGSKMTANSTDRAKAGTKSVKVANPGLNDVWEFDNAGNQALSGLTSVSMFVNVDTAWTAGDSVEIYGWDGTEEVGNRVKIEDYFDELVFDVWHPVLIPLADMGLSTSTITDLRMQLVGKAGAAPTFYIDVMQFEETGGGIEFRAAAPTSKAFHANRLTITMVDALAGTLADATMPALAHDKLLALTSLANGFLLTQVIDGVIDTQVPITELGDLFLLGFVINAAISDGTNTLLTVEVVFDEPRIMKPTTNQNYSSIVVRDDMTGLIRFQAVLRGANVI